MPIRETWECDLCHIVIEDPSPEQVKDWRRLTIKYVTLNKSWTSEQLEEDQPLLCGNCIVLIKEKLDA